MLQTRGTWFYTDDQTIKNILEAYCEGRGPIYRMFFGWRGTIGEIARYHIASKRKFYFLKHLIDEVSGEKTT